jgi:hypothetical protein
MTDQHAEQISPDGDFDRYATLETATETIVYEVENPAAWISSDAVVALDDAR